MDADCWVYLNLSHLFISLSQAQGNGIQPRFPIECHQYLKIFPHICQDTCEKTHHRETCENKVIEPSFSDASNIKKNRKILPGCKTHECINFEKILESPLFVVGMGTHAHGKPQVFWQSELGCLTLNSSLSGCKITYSGIEKHECLIYWLECSLIFNLCFTQL